MSKPPKHIDHIRNHLPKDDRHFKLPALRTPSEIEYWHEQMHGARIATFELRGLQAARTFTQRASTAEDIRFINNVLAPAGEVSAWYLKFFSSTRMRRVGHIPMLGFEDIDLRPTARDVHEQSKDALGQAIAIGHGFVRAHETRARDIHMHREALGTAIGDAALLLSTIEIADTVRPMRPYATQMAVRDHGLAMFERSRTMWKEIGSHPSLAQLAYPDSDLSVYIRRSDDTPPNMIEAFEEATAAYAIPR